jgi:DNA-binding NarL/FixJ family response regulator
MVAGPLHEREWRVIELVAQGLKNSEIAQAIGTTEHIVKNYLRNIYDKLGFDNRVEIALWYKSRRHRGEMNTAGRYTSG